MTLSLVGLEWDALDPARLAMFWSALLGRDAEGTTIPDGGSGFAITFMATDEPKSGQNRIHFDLTTTSPADQAGMVEQTIRLGGSHADVGQTGEESHVVLADPEGDEFCAIEPGNRFLADTDLIGAVNCDGTHELGVFWSEALGWPLVWDEGEETAIQSPRGGSKITWSGTPLMPRSGRDRMRLVVSTDAPDADVERLVALGARRTGDDSILLDLDGNEFRIERAPV